MLVPEQCLNLTMRILIVWLWFGGLSFLYAQEFTNDAKYLEDQFYLGINYNILGNKPSNVSQSSLSYGLMGGFIKDIPLNSKRNFGIAVGLGYAVNSYYSNIIYSPNENPNYTLLQDNIEGFKRSKIETHLLEVPFQLRWRSSNDLEYRFWRIYGGFKLGYNFAGRSKLVTETTSEGYKNEDLEALEFGYSDFVLIT
jgi:hypothetical protein